jgi:hypothetical protein
MVTPRFRFSRLRVTLPPAGTVSATHWTVEFDDTFVTELAGKDVDDAHTNFLQFVNWGRQVRSHHR